MIQRPKIDDLNENDIVSNLDELDIKINKVINGIDINENVISIKIKDASGKLTVDEDGLDINLDSVESEISEVNNHISSLEADVEKERYEELKVLYSRKKH